MDENATPLDKMVAEAASRVELPSDLSEMPEGTVVAPANLALPDMVNAYAAQQAMGRRMRPDPEDEKLTVTFYKHPVDGLDHVEIGMLASKNFKPDFIVDDRHRQRFPRQWDAYINERSQYEGQTMLTDLAWISVGLRNHLAYHGVKTMEQLAVITDGNLALLGPGIRALRQRSHDEMEIKRKAEQFSVAEGQVKALQDELERERAGRDDEREKWLERMQALEDRMPPADTTAKRGRPAKAAEGSAAAA